MACHALQVTDRERYHHGDLRSALTEAAVAAARGGGEPAVGLNRLAAEVGVSPSAAYRHFPGGLEELLVAVGDVGRRELTERITLRMSEVKPSRDRATAATRRFRASGSAYVEYVLEQPGLFQVASRHDRGRAPDADPFALLEGCIDDLVDAGALPPERRRDAAEAAWATVHGLAVLMTEGPLRRLSAARRRRVIDRTLDMVQAGL
jgi:AcrR family transcriptional regulator